MTLTPRGASDESLADLEAHMRTLAGRMFLACRLDDSTDEAYVELDRAITALTTRTAALEAEKAELLARLDEVTGISRGIIELSPNWSLPVASPPSKAERTE